MKQRMRLLAVVPISLAAVLNIGTHPSVSLAEGPTTHVQTLGGRAYDISAGSATCLAGSSSCDYYTGNYSSASVNLYGFRNNRSSGAPSSVDLSCEHDFTTADGIRHHVYGEIQAYAGTTGESVGGFASAIGDTSEQGTNTLGLVSVRASDPNGQEYDKGSGSASGLFHADNSGDSLLGGHVAITLHASPGSGFEDYQTVNGNYFTTTTSVTSMSCVVSGNNSDYTTEVELE